MQCFFDEELTLSLIDVYMEGGGEVYILILIDTRI